MVLEGVGTAWDGGQGEDGQVGAGILSVGQKTVNTIK